MNKQKRLAPAWLLPGGLIVVANLANALKQRNHCTISGRPSGCYQAAGRSLTSLDGAEHLADVLRLEEVAVTFPNQLEDTCDLAGGNSLEAVDKFKVEPNGQNEFRRNIGAPIRKDTIFWFTSYGEHYHYVATASAKRRKSQAKYKCVISTIGAPSPRITSSQ